MHRVLVARVHYWPDSPDSPDSPVGPGWLGWPRVADHSLPAEGYSPHVFGRVPIMTVEKDGRRPFER